MWNVGAMVFIVATSFVSCSDPVPSQTGHSTTILCVVIASCVCVLCALCVLAAGCSEHPRWLCEWENNIAMNLRGPECEESQWSAVSGEGLMNNKNPGIYKRAEQLSAHPELRYVVSKFSRNRPTDHTSTVAKSLNLT
jgi:hypothetical protein